MLNYILVQHQFAEHKDGQIEPLVRQGVSQPVQTAGSELKLKNGELSEYYPLQINLVEDNDEIKFIKASDAEDRKGVVYYRHDFAEWKFKR